LNEDDPTLIVFEQIALGNRTIRVPNVNSDENLNSRIVLHTHSTQTSEVIALQDKMDIA